MGDGRWEELPAPLHTLPAYACTPHAAMPLHAPGLDPPPHAAPTPTTHPPPHACSPCPHPLPLPHMHAFPTPHPLTRLQHTTPHIPTPPRQHMHPHPAPPPTRHPYGAPMPAGIPEGLGVGGVLNLSLLGCSAAGILCLYGRHGL